VAFESIQVSGPQAAERSQPRLHLLKRFRLQPVETPLCGHRGFHETGLAQHSQVLRHGRLRHAKPTLDLSDRCDETRRLRIARRFGSAMISNTDSML
jgi:hypothetical protein